MQFLQKTKNFLLELKRIPFKIKDYNKLDNFQAKKYKELTELQNAFIKLEIEADSYKARYEQEEKHRKLLEEKILTKDPNEYDIIGVPKLNIKELSKAFKMSDNYTLNNVIELLKIDYIDTVTLLANSLEDSNSKDISISMNAIRVRTQEWINVLSKNTQKEEFFDRAKGEMKQVNKK